jgi:hypothetical protein
MESVTIYFSHDGIQWLATCEDEFDYEEGNQDPFGRADTKEQAVLDLIDQLIERKLL